MNDPVEVRNDDPDVPSGPEQIVEAIVQEPGAFQINTHTTRSPGGEIRGQIRGSPIK